MPRANGGRNALTFVNGPWNCLPYSIRVNAIVVAESWTPLYTKAGSIPLKIKKASWPVSSHGIPLEKRMTTPKRSRKPPLPCSSSKSSHTTGQLIHVDGGYVHLDRALYNNYSNSMHMRQQILQIHPKDNVWAALQDIRRPAHTIDGITCRIAIGCGQT